MVKYAGWFRRKSVIFWYLCFFSVFLVFGEKGGACFAQQPTPSEFASLTKEAQTSHIADVAKQIIEFLNHPTNKNGSEKTTKRKELSRLIANTIRALFFPAVNDPTLPDSTGYDIVRGLVGKTVPSGENLSSVDKAIQYYSLEVLQKANPPKWLTEKNDDYQQAWFELMIAIDLARDVNNKFIERRTKIQSKLKKAIEDLDRRAPKLPDGRLVYRDENNQLVDQERNPLTPDEEKYILNILKNTKKPSGEEEISNEELHSYDIDSEQNLNEMNKWQKKIDILKNIIVSIEDN